MNGEGNGKDTMPGSDNCMDELGNICCNNTTSLSLMNLWSDKK